MSQRREYGRKREKFGGEGPERRIEQEPEAVRKAINDLDQILSGDSSKTVDVAQALGKLLAKTDLSRSQIRNIYEHVLRMHTYNKAEIDMMRPRLAYVAYKEKDVRHLQKVLDAYLKKVNEENFKRFKDFFEAILAYYYFERKK